MLINTAVIHILLSRKEVHKPRQIVWFPNHSASRFSSALRRPCIAIYVANVRVSLICRSDADATARQNADKYAFHGGTCPTYVNNTDTRRSFLPGSRSRDRNRHVHIRSLAFANRPRPHRVLNVFLRNAERSNVIPYKIGDNRLPRHVCVCTKKRV